MDMVKLVSKSSFCSSILLENGVYQKCSTNILHSVYLQKCNLFHLQIYEPAFALQEFELDNLNCFITKLVLF